MRKKDNLGFIPLRTVCTEQKTVIVSGIGRCGTTGMIRALHATGLPKTGKRTQGTQDDHLFGPHLGNHKYIKHQAKLHDEKHKLWGFKYPLIWQNADSLKCFRNPVVVLMVRDSFCIAYRSWKASAKTHNLSYWISQIHSWEKEMYDWAFHRTTVPVALVSYEKFLLRPVTVMRLTTEFLNMNFDAKCIDEINAEDQRYTRGMSFYRFSNDNDD